jgi:hypothetical protein
MPRRPGSKSSKAIRVAKDLSPGKRVLPDADPSAFGSRPGSRQKPMKSKPTAKILLIILIRSSTHLSQKMAFIERLTFDISRHRITKASCRLSVAKTDPKD